MRSCTRALSQNDMLPESASSNSGICPLSLNNLQYKTLDRNHLSSVSIRPRGEVLPSRRATYSAGFVLCTAMVWGSGGAVSTSLSATKRCRALIAVP